MFNGTNEGFGGFSVFPPASDTTMDHLLGIDQINQNNQQSDPLIDFDEKRTANATTLNDTASTTIMFEAYSSPELHRIYYATENDAIQLRTLLASWNLSELFKLFERKYDFDFQFFSRKYASIFVPSAIAPHRATAICRCVKTYE